MAFFEQRYYNKAQLLTETRKSREDPFKEIACLQWLHSLRSAARYFPQVVGVWENRDEFVKVEQDCSLALLDLVMKPPNHARIPEQWVVHILLELVEGISVLHGLGFVHLDLSLENAMCNFETGR